MHRIDIDAYLEEDDAKVLSTKRIERKKRRLTQREKRIRIQSELIEHADKVPVELHQHFNPSFQPARHERVWLLEYLEVFYNGLIIDDILGKVKGGKEANVYCCAAHPTTGLELVAAKVYRPPMFRSLRNDARYRQGRSVMNEYGKSVYGRREALAMKNNTRFGQELRHVSWQETEFQTMQLLYDAGADVPKPVMQGKNVILMEYIGEAGTPAATLNQVTLEPLEARRIYDRLVRNLEIMLACHRVHADLSAFNILYWEGQFKIIDFPQAVDPRRNPDASDLFVRDVVRVCQYFERYHVGGDALSLADELWSRFRRSDALEAGERCEALSW